MIIYDIDYHVTLMDLWSTRNILYHIINGQRTSSKLRFSCSLLKINTCETTDTGEEMLLCLGRRYLSSLFQRSQKPEGFNGEGKGKGKVCCVQKKQVSRQLILCQQDPEQTCWHPWTLFLNVIKTYLQLKLGPSFLKASGLQIPKKES